MANETLNNNEAIGVQQETIQEPIVQPIAQPQIQTVTAPPVEQAPTPVQPIAQPVQLQPVAQPQLQPITLPQIQTVTAPVEAAPSVAAQPVQLQPITLPQIQTVTAPPVDIAPSVAVQPVQQAPHRGIDFTESARLIEQQKIDTDADLNRITAAKTKADINTLSHDTIAKNRDSGYVNARNLAVIRSNNNRLFDGLTASDNLFTTRMIALSNEKAKAEADFNSDDYQAWQNGGNDTYNRLLESGNFDGAFEFAEAMSDAGGGPAWEFRANPINKDAVKSFYDKNITENFNKNIVNPNFDIAVGTNVDSMQSMGESKNRIIQSLNQMPDQANWYAKNFYSGFDSTNPASFEAYGVDNQAEADIVQEFIDGNIDFTDTDIQDIYAEGFIKVVQNDKSKSDLKSIYGDIATKYQGSPTATNLLNAITDSDFGENGAVNFDGSTISTYGIPLNVNSMETAPGIDFYLTDWDGNPYVDGSDFNFDTSLDDPIEIGGVMFSNGELNDFYQGYHDEMGTEYAKLPEDQKNILGQQVMNQDEFKEEILNLLQAGNSKEDLQNLLSGKKKVVVEGAAPVFIEEDQVVKPDGTIVNFSSLDIDIDAFDPDERKIVEDIVSGKDGFSIHDLSEGELTQLQSQHPDILRKLADAGYLGRSSVTVDQFTKGNHGILDVSNNSTNNMFTGENTIELFNSLKDGSGFVMIGEDMYFVQGTAGRHNTAGGKGFPIIEWSLTALTGDKSGEKEIVRGQLTDDNGDAINEGSKQAASFIALALTTGIENESDSKLRSYRNDTARYYDQITSKETKDIIYDSYVEDGFTDKDFMKKYEQEFGTGGN
jgi:hypothetical protein